jgi:hypothetical protein
MEKSMKGKNVLDNTSSVPVVLVNRKRAAKKPVAKKPFQVETAEGVTIWCDTAEQAAAVARELEATAKSKPLLHNKWSVHEFQDFVNRVQYQQRHVLAFLLKAGNRAVLDDELRKAIGVTTNQGLAGVLSGITKVAQLLEIDPQRVYWMQLTYEKGKPVRRYYVTPAFARAAVENDWPSESALKDPDEDDEPRPD